MLMKCEARYNDNENPDPVGDYFLFLSPFSLSLSFKEVVFQRAFAIGICVCRVILGERGKESVEVEPSHIMYSTDRAKKKKD